MNLEIIEEAKIDLFEAVDYYESKEAGLGVRLASEFAEVTASIAQTPLLWHERPNGYRRVNFPVFPYYIAYILRSDVIIIIAIAHGSRRPRYWYDRITK